MAWLVRFAATVLLGLAVLVPAVLPTGSGDDSYEETRISSYVATFDVDESGELTVEENLTVEFPYGGKHGIFRFFDARDPNDPRARRVPQDLTVTRDGQPEDFDMLREGQGRYRVARIGSADRTLAPGTHVYVLTYTMDDVLLEDPDGSGSRFYWDLIPGGWRQAITSAELTVHLPAEAADVRCAQGAGATAGCTAEGEGTDTLTVSTSWLLPRTPVTISADLDTAPSETSGPPWPQRLDPVLGPNVFALAAVLALALAAGFWGWRLSRTTHEPTPPFPLLYAPPEGIGPVQAQYILTERINKQAFVGTLMHAAERGAVTLDRYGEGWSITDRQGAQGWAGLDEATSELAGLLSGPGTTFTAARKDVTAGKRLQQQYADVESTTKDWARRHGLVTLSGLGSAGGILVILAAVLTVVLLFWNPLNMSVLALVPGLFAIGAFELLLPGSGTRRTTSGRELWSRVGGFRRILSTPSSIQRFDFAGREELYSQYLPWAVALGCADEWAAKYRTEMGTEPPVPSYLPAYAGVHTGNHVDQMIGDFSSTLSSAISSYESTQRSSSGGGGGFSGGGGGGGGGGGSW